MARKLIAIALLSILTGCGMQRRYYVRGAGSCPPTAITLDYGKCHQVDHNLNCHGVVVELACIRAETR